MRLGRILNFQVGFADAILNFGFILPSRRQRIDMRSIARCITRIPASRPVCTRAPSSQGVHCWRLEYVASVENLAGRLCRVCHGL